MQSNMKNNLKYLQSFDEFQNNYNLKHGGIVFAPYVPISTTEQAYSRNLNKNFWTHYPKV